MSDFEKKYFQLDFASGNISTVDADTLNDISRAIEAASKNLSKRHNITLCQLKDIVGKVVIEVTIPTDKMKNFAGGYGNHHFRGIALNLLRSDHDKYEGYLKGARLFTYTEIPAPKINPSIDDDRFDLISNFIDLLKRSDTAALDKIAHIRTILSDESIAP